MSTFQGAERRPLDDELTLVGVITEPGKQWPDATQMPSRNDLISVSGKLKHIHRQRVLISVDSITQISQEVSLCECECQDHD